MIHEPRMLPFICSMFQTVGTRNLSYSDLSLLGQTIFPIGYSIAISISSGYMVTLSGRHLNYQR